MKNIVNVTCPHCRDTTPFTVDGDPTYISRSEVRGTYSYKVGDLTVNIAGEGQIVCDACGNEYLFRLRPVIVAETAIKPKYERSE